MRHLATLALALLVAACAANPATPGPTAAARESVSIADPSPSPTLPAQLPTMPSALPVSTPGSARPAESAPPRPTPATSETPQSDDSLPPGVSWSDAPVFPSPLLVVGKARQPAIADFGCPTVFYEPRNDPEGRAYNTNTACLPGMIAAKAPVIVAAGSPWRFESPAGWVLGAQVVDPGLSDEGPYVIVRAMSIQKGTPTGAVGMAGTERLTGPWFEIGRDEGFSLSEVAGIAPTESADYLVAVEAQVAMADRTWRTLGHTFVYWIRIP